MVAAIVEIEKSHTECLFAQIEFLKKENFSVTIVCSESVKKSVMIFNNYDNIKIIDFRENKLNTLIKIYRLYQFLNKDFDYVIFNTCSGNKVRNLCLFPFRGPKLIGVIHNLKKINNGNTQRIISKKVSKYFVLNDQLLKHIAPNQNLKFSSFYPIFFPKFDTLGIEKPKNELWICIPGQVEFSRRNYLLIANAIRDAKLNKNIKFILLGTISKKELESDVYSNMIHKFRALEKQNRIKLFSDFIDDATFHTYIKKSDYILPLLNNNDDYKKNKISGTINLAFSYKKPLIVQDDFSKFEDFKENAVFFSARSFVPLLNKLYRKPFAAEYRSEKWEFQYQQKAYIRFITE